MSKTFFDKKQAIAVLLQIENKKEVNVFENVESSHKYYSLSCEELEKKLFRYLDKDGFAGVVDQP